MGKIAFWMTIHSFLFLILVRQMVENSRREKERERQRTRDSRRCA